MNKRKIAEFCSQLRSLLASGMPLLEALWILEGLPQNKKHHVQLKDVIGRINEGYSLSEAVVGVLPAMVVGMLRAAERVGNLEETLKHLSKYYESKADLEEKMIGALVYPCFILVLSLLSVLVLLLFVLPGLKSMFVDLGTDLPPLTGFLLDFSDLFLRFWFVPVGLITIAGWLFAKRAKSERVENLILRMPLLGKLFRQELMIQGFGTLGALLNGGAPILEALAITANSSRSNIFRRLILKAKDGVENGEKLSGEFDEVNFFPKEIVQMLKVGESSGRLAEMLLSIADFQAREREYALKRFTTLLEPAMTLTVGAVVGFIVLAMFLPMVNMISWLQ